MDAVQATEAEEAGGVLPPPLAASATAPEPAAAPQPASDAQMDIAVTCTERGMPGQADLTEQPIEAASLPGVVPVSSAPDQMQLDQPVQVSTGIEPAGMPQSPATAAPPAAVPAAPQDPMQEAVDVQAEAVPVDALAGMLDSLLLQPNSTGGLMPEPTTPLAMQACRACTCSENSCQSLLSARAEKCYADLRCLDCLGPAFEDQRLVFLSLLDVQNCKQAPRMLSSR